MRRNVLFLALFILLVPAIAFAQYDSEMSDEAAGCLGCSIVFVSMVFGVVWLGLSIWATV